MTLTEKKCIPCEDKSIAPLSCSEAKDLFRQYESELSGWGMNDACTHIMIEKLFPDFVAAMDFINHIAKIAEDQGHHPDVAISYNRVNVDLWTHSIGGLSENDFILAAKINAI